MKNPQTLAEELTHYFNDKNLKAVADYGCCAFVLMWCLGIEPDNDIDAVLKVIDLIQKKKIKEDCTVEWAKAIKYLSGRELKEIKFVDSKYISCIKKRTPVRYDYKGKSHWVGVENGVICFNPLAVSICVTFGHPGARREISLEGEENE